MVKPRTHVEKFKKGGATRYRAWAYASVPVEQLSAWAAEALSFARRVSDTRKHPPQASIRVDVIGEAAARDQA
jgi:hypothetical protein